MSESTNKVNFNQNPLQQNVLYRGSVDIAVNSAIAFGFTGSATVSLSDLFDVVVLNPVIFAYEFQNLGGGNYQLVPLPYTRISDAGAVTIYSNFNIFQQVDGSVDLNFIVRSSSSINVSIYYLIYSTSVSDTFIFNP